MDGASATLADVGRRVRIALARQQIRRQAARTHFAEPLGLDDQHEVIRRVDQERDESLQVLAEMQRAKQHPTYSGP